MSPKFCAFALLLIAAVECADAGERARNVILFLGDAGGVPTLSAASLYAHDKPQALFIHGMPHIALCDTSALDAWVTDSAAGMTAFVTGQKTNNGMISVLPGYEGRSLKTILEYAEENGLSTGVVTNMAVWDATPAACYAHASSRKSTVEIFSQVFTPRFGDGVDVLIGADRNKLFAAAETAGLNPRAAMQKAGYEFFETPSAMSDVASRAMSIYDGEDFRPEPVIDTVLQILSRNEKGFFLMVEWDMHTKELMKGLDRAIVMDELIRHVAGKVSSETLIIYAADHSFDLRMRGGRRGGPLAPQILATAAAPPPSRPVISVENFHTAEDIVVAAQGPGAELVRGFLPNTRLFQIMLSAYGWSETPLH
jgi:alkaline phosphatase